ncbi:Translin-associated factor X-interacting protein 1 [Quaeritorhiza haematococci]|nr:Translin-associated factor X-interacting protein 1 [Quaeritorhiza haematococci]
MPRFLLQITQYMQNELKLLGVESAPPGDYGRLQVFREIFEPLKGKLTVARFTAARELDQVRAEALEAIHHLKDENESYKKMVENLNVNIETLKNQNRAMMEDLRQREQGMFHETKIRELQAHLEETMINASENMKHKNEEISAYKAKLQKVSNDYNAANVELENMKSLVSQMVPSEMHESMRQELEGLKSSEEELQCHLTNALTEKMKLEQKVRDAEFALKKKDEEQFPDWDHIQSICPSSIQEWGLKCKGLNYHDSLTVLLRELIRLDSLVKSHKIDNAQRTLVDDSEPRFFIGLGLSSDVPKYLRYKGKVPNRQLSKRDCVALIKDIWSTKAIFDSKARGHRSSLENFFYSHLKKRFGSQQIIAEWGYNIHEAAKKYCFQSIECRLFFDILTGEADAGFLSEISKKFSLGRKLIDIKTEYL